MLIRHNVKGDNPNGTGPAPVLMHVFPSFKVGGAQVRFAQIANHFGPSYRHIILALDGSYDCAERLGAGVDARMLRLERARGGTFANALAYRKILAGQRPDLLITYNWGAIEWAIGNFLKLCPHIHIEDGFGPEEANGQLRRRVVTRRIALSRSVVVLPSRTLHDIATGIWKLNERRLRYIPNGIDCAKFTKAADPVLAARLPPRRAEVPVIGTIAALRGEKRLDRLVSAFHRLVQRRPAHLVIVGDGGERAALEGQVRQLGLSEAVSFTGHVAEPDRIIGAFDIAALSSDTEQMPYSVLEAMAAGLAVATTDVGDVRNMVAPENLPFVTPRDDVALAEALQALAEDAALRRAVGAANCRKVNDIYDQSAMFAAYDGLFRSLIAR